ncbi:MAG: hypothetical protein WCA78_00515 [Rhizomicrobium sp.]
MPKKREPIIVYGARIATLADLARSVDDMNASAARREITADHVEFEGYISLNESSDGLFVDLTQES